MLHGNKECLGQRSPLPQLLCCRLPFQGVPIDHRGVGTHLHQCSINRHIWESSRHWECSLHNLVCANGTSNAQSMRILQASSSFFFFFLIFIYLTVPSVSCSMWDLVPWAGIEPRSSTLGVWSLSPSTAREVPLMVFSPPLGAWEELVPRAWGPAFSNTWCTCLLGAMKALVELPPPLKD